MHGYVRGKSLKPSVTMCHLSPVGMYIQGHCLLGTVHLVVRPADNDITAHPVVAYAPEAKFTQVLPYTDGTQLLLYIAVAELHDTGHDMNSQGFLTSPPLRIWSRMQ